mgnify:CR=1 FL=1
MKASEILEHCNTYYEYREGELYYKARPANCIQIGQCASQPRKDGYRQTKIKGKHYLTHRLIWLMHKGKFPDNTIDHKDRVRANNLIDNLRDVTQGINNQNTGRGYYWCKRERKFLVYKQIDGKKTYIGRADTEEEAEKLKC